MAECLFCGIAAGTVPSERVVETETTVAFRDIAPQAPVHVLVVPRRHVTSLAEVEPADAGLLGELVQTVQAVAEATGIAERGYRVVANVGEDALNSVDHLHLHVLGGRRLRWPPG